MSRRNLGLVLLAIAVMGSPGLRAEDKKPSAAKPSGGDGTFEIEDFKDRSDSSRFLSQIVDDRIRRVWVTDTGARHIGIVASPADPVLRAHLPQTKGKYGLVITSVVKDSPAAKAGIEQRDILLRINGEDLAQTQDLLLAVQKLKAEQNAIDASILHRGAPKTIRLTLPKAVWTDKGHLNPLIAKFITLTDQSKYMIGVQPMDADPSLLVQLNLPQKSGVIIQEVTADSPAAKAGLKQYDLILAAGNTYLLSTADLTKAVDKSEGKPITLQIIRSGKKVSVTVTPIKRPNLESGSRIYKTRAFFGGGEVDYDLMVAPGAAANWHYRPTPPKSLELQVDRLSKEIEQLRKSLDLLTKQLASDKGKK